MGGILILLAFMLFFYGPLIYMFMLAFANTYNFPDIVPSEFGFNWWISDKGFDQFYADEVLQQKIQF